MGYEWCERQLKNNYLFFMDDLKFFGKYQNQIDSLVNTLNLFSSDVVMTTLFNVVRTHSQSLVYRFFTNIPKIT